MIFLPIVGRHLRVASRLQRTYRGRMIAVGACLLPAIWVVLIAYSNVPLFQQGTQLFKILSNLLFFYCLLAGARLTSDCLSEEKREGTLGLLFLTDLKGYDVVLGKMAASSVTTFYQLLAVLPLIGLALLLGGISGLQFARTILVLLNTLFFSLAVGMFVSTVSRHERKAMFGTAILIGLLTGLPYVLAEHFAYNGQRGTAFDLNLAFAVPSPYFAFDLASSPAKGAILASDLYESLLITHLTGWCFLVLASAILPSLWHQRSESAAFARWGAKFQVWCYGSESVRKTIRFRLLHRNPFLWLANRDRVKMSYPWILMAVALGGWMTGCFAYPNLLAVDWEPTFALVMTIHFVFKIWITSEVCARFTEDRRHGAWELLLSSPLTVKQILTGENLALRRQFAGPILLLFGVDLLLLRAASNSSLYVSSKEAVSFLFLGMMFMHWMDCHTLKWVAIWRTLRVQSLNQALVYSVTRILILPVVVWAACWYTFVLQIGLPPSINLFIPAWFGLGFVTDLFFWPYARNVVTKRFRALAAGEPESNLESHPPPETKQKKSRAYSFPLRFRFLRSRWAMALIFAVVVAWTGLAFYRHALRRRAGIEIELVRQAGYPVTKQQLDQWLGFVPVLDDAALEINQAISKSTQNRLNFKTFNHVRHRGLINETEKAALSAIVANNVVALAHLRRASITTNSRFPIQWNQDLSTPLAYLDPEKNLVELAAADELIHLANRDSAEALASFLALLAIPRALANEPTPISQMARLKMIETVHFALEHLLAHAKLSEEQLKGLAALLASAESDNERGMIRGFIGLRCMGIDLALLPPREFFLTFLNGGDNTGANVFTTLYPFLNMTGLHERDLLLFLKTMNDYCEAAQLPFPARSQKYREIGERASTLFQSHRQFDLSGVLLRVIGNAPQIQAAACARLRISQIAVAVERSRLRDGRLPQTLGSLGELIPKGVEIDPFDGRQLRYKVLSTGYIVYSVGKNGVDNNGDFSQHIVFAGRQ